MFLFDTHLLIWAAINSNSLSPEARTLIDRAGRHRWFSAASLWEIAIKHALSRVEFEPEPRRFRRGLLDNGWRELAVTSEHGVAISDLPPLHRDPFDRLLLAQAHVEGFVLVTSDARVAQYPGAVRRV